MKLEHTQDSADHSKACGYSREGAIRTALATWLAVKHATDASTVLIHELDIPRPSGRVDVALINGLLAGYEIKSEVDSFARLQMQQASFSSVFERMTLVVTGCHTRAAPSAVPPWWEILEARGSNFKVIRRGRANPNLNLENLLYVLNKSELLRVEDKLKFELTSAKRKKSEIIDSILSVRQVRRTLSLSRETLKRRASGRLSERDV